MKQSHCLLAVALPLLLAGAGYSFATTSGLHNSWAQQLQLLLQNSVPLHLLRPVAPASAPAPASEEIHVGRPGSVTNTSSVTSQLVPDPSITCTLHGTIDETANCTYEAVDFLNQHHLNPLLSKLVQTAFFRYFKVNIHCDCPLWPDDSMCSTRSCSVCECEPQEVPQPWIAEEKGSCAAVSERGTDSAAALLKEPCNTAQCLVDAESRVDTVMEPRISRALRSLKGWRGLNNPWMANGDDDEEYLYINLLVNPERYTGYQGEHAHRIWNAIYSQSCFDGPQCTERRVFYRLISGMHASISAHIAAKYPLVEEDAAGGNGFLAGSSGSRPLGAARNPFGSAAILAAAAAGGGGRWGPSLEQFEARLGAPEYRERVENLYFAYLFVLRAVMKAAPLMETFDYHTGLPMEDAATAQLVQELAGRRELHSACPLPFDEGRLWKGVEGPLLREQLQKSFQNITRIMDCVGCEKCKLWGKLQTLGIATALKILFSSADCGDDVTAPPPPPQYMELERNELIALVNLLERLSASLETYRKMSKQLADRKGVAPAVDVQESLS